MKVEKNKWYDLDTEKSIKSFMYDCCAFHDSCVKEIRYISGSYTTETGLYPVNDVRCLSIIFHGYFQEFETYVIELKFSGLKHFIMNQNDKFSSEILQASLFRDDNYIVWSNDDFENAIDALCKGEVVVVSEGLQWRALDNSFLGSDTIYGD